MKGQKVKTTTATLSYLPCCFLNLLIIKLYEISESHQTWDVESSMKMKAKILKVTSLSKSLYLGLSIETETMHVHLLSGEKRGIDSKESIHRVAY